MIQFDTKRLRCTDLMIEDAETYHCQVWLDAVAETSERMLSKRELKETASFESWRHARVLLQDSSCRSTKLFEGTRLQAPSRLNRHLEDSRTGLGLPAGYRSVSVIMGLRRIGPVAQMDRAAVS